MQPVVPIIKCKGGIIRAISFPAGIVTSCSWLVLFPWVLIHSAGGAGVLPPIVNGCIGIKLREGKAFHADLQKITQNTGVEVGSAFSLDDL